MNYLSIPFAFFLPAAVLGFYLCPPRRRSLFLLLASYVFYVTWSPLAALGILGATIFAFLMGPLLEREPDSDGSAGSNRRAMAVSVTLLLVFLFFFKALGPLKQLLAGSTDTPAWLAALLHGNSLLPLGISYYSFKLISYLVDVYWEKIPAERSFIDFATYVSFFPQIVAGPIQRSGDFLEQIREPSGTPEMMTNGLRRLLLGCFKKTIIADNLGTLINLAYPQSTLHFGSAVLPAFYLFPIQLYADFSALTDIAVGTALLFGIHSPENFNAPFLATSMSQFWRRWHMTLTNWLSDYVFLPLRMATRRAGNWGLAFSLMVNMLLIGLWHNLSWTFAVFGLLHGVFLVIDALTARARTQFFKLHAGWDRAANGIGPVFTFHLVALSMVFVRAESLPQAIRFLSHLLVPDFHFLGVLQNRETIVALAGLVVWTAFELSRRLPRVSIGAVPVWGRWAFYYSVIAVIAKYGHNAEGFIYFKF